jgi:2-polyprenyl-3-methyl-5-hydroxy-6-metoxy-1,4-benzoquinol methylase
MAHQTAQIQKKVDLEESRRLEREEQFHDQWASNEDASQVDVIDINEACTSPELRSIHATLGDITGKRVLDVGCGRGEVSVYFARRGAKVTAFDISSEMLRFTQELAAINGVSVDTKHASAELMMQAFSEADKGSYDILYLGNVLHHVDMEKTLPQLFTLLKPEGTFASWDPVAYNPIINIYRRLAMGVRTVDEHPFTKRDVAYLSSCFKETKIEFYWLTALMIFIMMTFILFRNPNKIRFWKVVVDESSRWAPIYKPLAAVDRLLLRIFPPLRWLCWNVVIVGKGLKK